MLKELLAAVAPVSGVWLLLLSAALAAASLGWWMDRSSLKSALDTEVTLRKAAEKKRTELAARLDASTESVEALQRMVAENQSMLAESRRKQREREAAVLAARTRKVKDDEILDEASSERVLRHIGDSLGGVCRK